MQEVVVITKAGYLSEKVEHNRDSPPAYSNKEVDHVSPGRSLPPINARPWLCQ
jgi:hypothetical protein